MSFLERLGFRRRIAGRRELEVEFLGPQDGVPETRLKTALRAEFASLPQVRAAYLTRVRYQNGDEVVALSIDATERDQQAVLRRVQDCFAQIFAQSQYLDILFLNDIRRRAIARVAEPFYRAAELTAATVRREV